MVVYPENQKDGYKVDHRSQYPEGTELVYSNFTPRSTKYMPTVVKDDNKIVVFGLQYLIKWYLIEEWNRNFFEQPKEKVMKRYTRRINNYLGAGAITFDHIEALHDLGYLPIKIKALPEGSVVDARVPILTVENTLPDFFWLTNMLETVMSCMLWKLSTSATTARKYRMILDHWCEQTGGVKELIPFQGHDFSFRGMSGIQDAQMSGAGHLLSFAGTDSIPSIDFLEEYYNADSDKELVGCSVPASEHSVMCMGGVDTEIETFKRLIAEVYPKGIVSIVSDTWDYWKIITEFLPKLKDTILSRSGGALGDKVVIRPDCYDEDTQILTDSGWKYFKDLTKDDKVASEWEGQYIFETPHEIVEYDYDGEMCHFTDHHGKVDLLVTPNHRMIVNVNGRERVIEAKDMLDSGHHYQYMSRSAKYCGDPRDPINHENKVLSDFERLMIAFQADGSYMGDGNKTSVRFSFSKKRKMDRLESICDKCELNYSKYYLCDGRVEYNIKVDASLLSKDFSWVDLNTATFNYAKEFIEELSYWDSHRRSDDRFKFDTTNKSVIDVVERIAINAGYGVLISEYEDNRSDKFSKVYTANILKNNKVGGQSWEKQVIDYSGKVYCVKVSTGKLIVKRNRCTMVCGNSGDPVEIICGIEIETIDCSEEDFHDCAKDILYDRLVDQTPHGEYGGDIKGIFRNNGKVWECHFDPDWSRHDKQYYYIDEYGDQMTKKEIELSPQQKGSIECMWKTFGGTVTETGHKLLDSHIGLIYGDSITLDRCQEICRRLAEKGFCSSNVVFGIGSYTYEYVTRDTLGFAMKATAGIVNGEVREIFKDPKTDGGMKKSAKGFIVVDKDMEGNFIMRDQVTQEEAANNGYLLDTFVDGKLLIDYSVSDIKKTLYGE